MNEERKTYIAYRRERALKTLDEARLLMENGFWNAAANRIYYACFYMLSALFLTENENPPLTHAGVKSKFNRDYILPRKVSVELGRFYSRVFNKRQDGDYKDLVAFSENEISPLFEEAVLFLNVIEQLISEK